MLSRRLDSRTPSLEPEDGHVGDSCRGVGNPTLPPWPADQRFPPAETKHCIVPTVPGTLQRSPGWLSESGWRNMKPTLEGAVNSKAIDRSLLSQKKTNKAECGVVTGRDSGLLSVRCPPPTRHYSLNALVHSGGIVNITL